MTLEEVKNCTKEFLTPAQVAAVLGTDQQAIRVAARQEPERLGFPTIIIGSRVKIPKRAFLKFMGGDT